MDTKLVTKQIRIKQWSEIIRDRKESGLMVDDYCERNGISRNQYYYWLREIKKQALESYAPQLVELQPPAAKEQCQGTLPASENKFNTEMIINVRGASICINSATPPELLARVVGVIANA